VNQLRAELLKIRSTRTSIGLLVGLVALALLFTILTCTLSPTSQVLGEQNQISLLSFGSIAGVFAALAGITDAAALIAIFGANVAMILFGLAMERVNVGRDTIDWRPFIYGCIVGAVPWIAIAVEIIVAQSQTSAVPGFVYAIFVTLFLLFNTFALNMWLQYRGRGRWADPVFCERVYLMLSIVAKTALAWQVYFGALAGK